MVRHGLNLIVPLLSIARQEDVCGIVVTYITVCSARRRAFYTISHSVTRTLTNNQRQ